LEDIGVGNTRGHAIRGCRVGGYRPGYNGRVTHTIGVREEVYTLYHPEAVLDLNPLGALRTNGNVQDIIREVEKNVIGRGYLDVTVTPDPRGRAFSCGVWGWRDKTTPDFQDDKVYPLSPCSGGASAKGDRVGPGAPGVVYQHKPTVDVRQHPRV
jgi:hypothetical protein